MMWSTATLLIGWILGACFSLSSSRDVTPRGSCCGSNNNNNKSTTTYFCPNGNKCCDGDGGTSATVVPTCISGKDGGGDCCGHKRGCGSHYRCKTGFMCELDDDDDDDHDGLPRELPQYHLCSAGVANKDTMKVYHTPSGAAYLASQDPFSTASANTVDTVWIVVHGSGHNPDDYLCCAMATVEQEERMNTTIVIAPWFLPYEGNDDDDNVAGLRWREHGPIAHTWRYGANAVGSNTSSYDVLDELVMQTTRHQQRLIVAGHSAGGQYVQRWALLTNTSRPFRAVVANPKSFCWLDDRRVFATNNSSAFRRPNPDAVALCPTYNEWEWGFEPSTGQHREGGEPLIAPYVDRALAQSNRGVDAIVQRYATRDVVYLAGELDVLWNGDCEARMQGDCRLLRSQNFYTALQEIYGRPVHRRFVVSGVHHDHCLMFQSPEGRFALFGSHDGHDSSLTTVL